MKIQYTLALAMILAAGCKEGPDTKRYRVTFEVRADRMPLAGVRLSVGGRPVAQTDAQGEAQLALPGTDGTQHMVTVTCPSGTRSPVNPVQVTLRTLVLADQAAARRGIVQTVDCPPIERTLGVVVRTEGQSNIPIFWQGREIARTDLGGVAHLSFRVLPQTQLQLELHTSENPLLRPENPRQNFLIAETDDIQTWDQTFAVERARPARRASVRRSAPTRGPTPIRIQSGSSFRSFRH
ncbi:MAG: hypothetical protein Q8Q09_16640 [Deltaproteobacteria bacterium]|nr:hypothetical protein [Deltaproteobacteria bacterium]